MQKRSNMAVIAPLLPVLALAACTHGAIVLDGTARSSRFDGHGGLSAGASSRLLFDYPAWAAGQILDYLWKPNFGASLHICKVEIGGDVQSTDGTEASHKHTRFDLNYERGYEWWLMAEAKKRNPDVLTYALSWGVPGWVGNGSYFSDDNIAYQVDFVKGARDVYNITIDYIGIWNERPWGNPTYVKDLRSALDAAGFSSTTIVGADGGIPADQIAALKADPVFSEAEPILGRHYPCANPEPPSFWELQPAKTFWANEDYSTVGNWAGASCWGRSLSQNWVKLNATSTIAWSTIWSVYDSWPYYGNGLMYAYSPWSAHYTVNPPIWTSAQTTQFVQPGWSYLGGSGSGLLPQGGSWVAYVPPATRTAWAGEGRPRVEEAGAGDFSLVIEKLDKDCLRCHVPPTSAETLQFQLAGDLLTPGHTSLAAWLTNETHWFVRLADVPVSADGKFTVTIGEDTIISLTTTTGQAKGSYPTPAADHPFPMPYSTNYNYDKAPQPAAYHADNSGSFEVQQDGGNGALFQAQPIYPAGTQWEMNYDPITSLGNTGWVNVAVSVDINILAPAPPAALLDPDLIAPHPVTGLFPAQPGPISTGAYAGACVRAPGQWDTGYCLLVGAGLVGGPSLGWVLQQGTGTNKRVPGTILAQGALPGSFNLSAWHSINLTANGPTLSASIDGAHVATYSGATAFLAGLVALRTGYHFARFDNLNINGTQGPLGTLFASTSPADCTRNDFTGPVGAAFVVGASQVTLTHLGRFAPGSIPRNVAILTPDGAKIAQVTISGTTTDVTNFVYTQLDSPVRLAAGATYYLVSYETDKGGSFCDCSSGVSPSDAVTSVQSLYYYEGAWHTGYDNHMYGPLNALME
eukprot:m.165727 g.165727  ORF g.165727 m.165727 type:complete len:861 (+) comp9895_c0_seq4:1721-4303(+)